jgi:hypothetical protein
MTTHSFDHERLDVYRLAIEYVAVSFDASESLDGRHRAWFGDRKCRHPGRAIGDAGNQVSRRCYHESDTASDRRDGVAESSAEYQAEIDYDYEHRFAEHEHEVVTERTPDW